MNPTDSTTDMNEVRERQSYLSLEFFCYYNISHLGVQEFVYETNPKANTRKSMCDEGSIKKALPRLELFVCDE